MVVAPKDGRTDCPRIDVTMDDHPLSINPDSKWQTFFKDNEVLLQIDKDVRYKKLSIFVYMSAIMLGYYFSKANPILV
jgi:hypothetical protein